MIPTSHYANIATLVFCCAIVLLSINLTYNRRTFRSIIESLFVPRIRSQFFRESKLYNEWSYAFCLIFNILMQSLLLFYLLVTWLPSIGEWLNLNLLYLLCIVAVTADHFLKFLNSKILGNLFNCPEEATIFNHNKFFYLSANSLALLLILPLTIYLGYPTILFGYLPVFLTTYVLMFFRTLTIKKSSLSIFQFFLYFCTLEILPYLVVIKLLFFLR